MANAIFAAAELLMEEIQRQLEAWNHRPEPKNEAAFKFPRVGGLPMVQHNEQPLIGNRWIAVGMFGRRDNCSPPPAAAWWTKENRERYALHCQGAVRRAGDALIEAARSAGHSAVLIEPLAELRRRHEDFLRQALRQDENGLLTDPAVDDAWKAIYPAVDRLWELVDELVPAIKPPELTPVQEAIYGVLTDEYQTVPQIAGAAGVNDDSVRRELGNLKLRLRLVDHKHGKGYRRL